MATDASATIAVPEINSSTPTLITINATAQLPVKLTPTNYPSWRAQFNALLYGYDLMGYVDGSSLCPSTTQPVLRTFWIRQDQLLLHAILASVSPQVISLIASAKTSKEAWDKLLRLFASKARARVLGLKERLTLLRRENKSVSEYLQEVRVIADELAIIDVPLSDDDLLLYILNGVGSDFKEIAAVVRSRDTSISFENLHDKLVEHEAALKRDDTVVAAPVITANVTQTSRSHTSNRGYRSNNSNSNRGSFASRNPSRGSFGHPHTSSIDNNSRGFNGPTQPAFTDNSRRSTHMNSTGYRGFCQWCGTQGHSAKRCPQLQYGSHSQPVANPTSHGRSTSSPTWLLDSGASHHVTSNVNTLSGASPYDGPDEIIIGNGSGLGITHVGSTTVPSSSSQSFTLSNTSRSHTSNRGYRSNNSNSNRGSFASRNPSRGSFGHPHTSSIDNNSRGFNGPTQPAFTDNSQHSPTMPVAPVGSSSMPSHDTSSSSSASAPVSEPSPSVALAPIAPLLPSSNPQASVPTSTAPIITPPVHYPAQNDLAQPPPHLSPIRTYTRNPNRTVVTFPSSDPHPSNPPIPPVHPDHSMVTRAKAGIHKPNPRYAMTATTHPILSSIEPTCVSQAVKDPLWRQAMSNEFNALIRNGTWELIPSLPSQNLIGCKWVFRIKRHPDGTIDRYKARLVAKGFHQRPGVDFSDTFSPVVKPTTIRIVLHLAVTHGWPIRQLDVNNAFLHGTLLENVYMVQPPGFVDSNHPSYVCKLRKALYGLKQAPRAWYKELHSFLLSHGFVNAISDASLFLFKNGTTVIYFLVYVDDLLITGNNSTLVAKFIQLLATRFSVKDLGSLHYFLGVEVLPTATGLFLSQQKYIHDLLVNAKMDGAKAVSTPLSTTDSLMLHDGSPLTDPTPYRRLVGGLQYLSLTRPDISLAVNKLSQFMHSPSETHWQALKRLLRYLKGTISFGLHLCRRPSNRLYAFSDADWAGDHDDRKSTTGYVVYLGGNLISWSSRKQRSVSRSSTEAEYRAIAATTSELTWIQSLLRELGIPLPTPPVVSCDNIGAMFYCANPVLHSRMKHIEIDFQFVRDRVTRGLLQVSHVSTTDQLADALTKPLPRPRFHLLRSKIGVSDGATVLRGRIREPPTSKEISSSPTQSAPSIDSVN
ncbi:hypothetical protein L3X38_015693 [Prunus dulcis]|uniref:CCHC-type domain-containing protein n=1 Tax=Prunus dulcis TaxID=3755 RepID=A0AAD4Z8F6_PRUDU|nr:hypothetical protein L3X38_015693 [Prunus dulcis]